MSHGTETASVPVLGLLDCVDCLGGRSFESARRRTFLIRYVPSTANSRGPTPWALGRVSSLYPATPSHREDEPVRRAEERYGIATASGKRLHPPLTCEQMCHLTVRAGAHRKRCTHACRHTVGVAGQDDLGSHKLRFARSTTSSPARGSETLVSRSLMSAGYGFM